MIEGLCKICSHDVRTIYDEQFAVNYYYCSNCRFIFMDDEKILVPEQEQQRYLRHTNTLEDTGYVNMLKTFINKSITPFHQNIKTTLDFGSGPGPVLSRLLREMGYETDIYDIYFAPEKVYLEKTYDLITCTEVLEHLKDPLETLRMLKDHLKAGGILAVMTLFHPVYELSATPDQLPCQTVFKDWWYRRDPTHISFFRPETFYYVARFLDMTILMMDQKNTVSFRK
ncbi:MAG: class I SAM-dependent methyltransferase [Candidatus Aminicenantes bacterium]|nr:MAG: class I SAM-dependent methyltransferase [Candidatus Aminicenantes bacterium]